MLILALMGWRLPFAVVGIMSLVIWILLWGWFPRRQQQQRSQTLSFFSHYREVGSHGMVWYVLGANMCQQMVFFGMLGYLATYLMQTYHLSTTATALPWRWRG